MYQCESSVMHHRPIVSRKQQTVDCSACALYGICQAIGLEAADSRGFEEVVRRCEPITSQQQIVHPAMPVGEILAVKSGSFKAYITAPNNQQKIVGFFLPGELIGLEGIGLSHPPYTVEALESGSVCRLNLLQAVWPGKQLEMFQQQLITALSGYALQKQSLALLLGAQSAEQRIALFLLGISERFTEHKLPGLRFKLPMSRHDMANYLGLAVETVSRMVQRMQSMDILEVHGRHLVLNDQQGLRAIAGINL